MILYASIIDPTRRKAKKLIQLLFGFLLFSRFSLKYAKIAVTATTILANTIVTTKIISLSFILVYLLTLCFIKIITVNYLPKTYYWFSRSAKP